MLLEPDDAVEGVEDLARLLFRARGAHERDGEVAGLEELLHAGAQPGELVLAQGVEQREEEDAGLGLAFGVQALAEPDEGARRRARRAQDLARQIRGPVPEAREEHRQHPRVVLREI